MPVEVSLESLVCVFNSRAVWPEKFRELIDAVEAAPDDRGVWSAIADYCREHDEDGLATAADWIARHPEVVPHKNNGQPPYWTLTGLPHALDHGMTPVDVDISTLAGRLADLARRHRNLMAMLT